MRFLGSLIMNIGVIFASNIIFTNSSVWILPPSTPPPPNTHTHTHTSYPNIILAQSLNVYLFGFTLTIFSWWIITTSLFRRKSFFWKAMGHMLQEYLFLRFVCNAFLMSISWVLFNQEKIFGQETLCVCVPLIQLKHICIFPVIPWSLDAL